LPEVSSTSPLDWHFVEEKDPPFTPLQKLFTKSLAQELAPRIRVNAIAAGYVDTDMTKGLLPNNLFFVEVN
jgi:hypothetical protein